MTEISKIIRGRWSPREYDPDFSISCEEMNQILEAARWAPSAMNTQEWWFVPGIRGDKNYEVLRRAVAGFSDWALDASGLILNIHQEYPSRHGLDFGPYDLGSAVQNMLLQAEVMGLHMRPFATFARELVSQVFQIAPPYVSFTMCTVGKAPTGLTKERERKPLEQLLWENHQA